MNSSVVNSVKIMYFVLFRYIQFHFYSDGVFFYSCASLYILLFWLDLLSTTASIAAPFAFITPHPNEEKTTTNLHRLNSSQFVIINGNAFHLLMLTIYKEYFVIACNTYSRIFSTSFYFVANRFLHA